MSERHPLVPFGWAPGGYTILCSDPDCADKDLSAMEKFRLEHHTGDKRCWRCRVCAERKRDRSEGAKSS